MALPALTGRVSSWCQGKGNGQKTRGDNASVEHLRSFLVQISGHLRQNCGSNFTYKRTELRSTAPDIVQSIVCTPQIICIFKLQFEILIVEFTLLFITIYYLGHLESLTMKKYN